MMKKIIILTNLLVIGIAHAQTTTENYIQSRTYLEPVTATSTTAKQVHTVEYFDGLGRSKQVVNVKASPLGKDIVTPIEYDQFGRQVKDYLPVPQSGTQNGNIFLTPLSNVTSTPYGAEKIYAEKILENSPLDRIQQQVQVGTDWSQKPVIFEYASNIAGEVKKYSTVTTTVNNATSSTISLAGTYTAGQLYKNVVIDEDGSKTIEFKNGKDQLILVRKEISSTENADTYYVYNKYDQLSFVIPPLASVSSTINTTLLDNLCYQYRYDGNGRLVEKKIPGKGWEYMVYNKADQLVMSQDANLRAAGQWLLTKYDKLGRELYTGISNNSSARNTVQTNINANTNLYETRTSAVSFTLNGMPVYYTKVAGPTSVAQILSVNYYDTYPTEAPTTSTVLGQAVLPQNAQTSNTSTKNFPVASYIKNIEDDNWTKIYTYYDNKGRAIKTYSVNHLGGYTDTETELDFSGVPKQGVTKHKRLSTDTERVVKETFTYDSQNRVLTHTHQVDSNPVEILAQNTYNELSQVTNKKVGGTTVASPLQSIDYTYNIRGWLTKINDPANLNGKLFGYQVRYNNPVYNNIATGRYNGNITEIDWNISTEGILKRYSYKYDKLSRLLDGIYTEPNSTTPYNNNYNENLTYDLNGNIKTLKRNGLSVWSTVSTLVDDLEYVYSGNQLTQVKENSLNDTGYEGGNNAIDYDVNGNMLNMKDKGISSIGYNYLNLPNATAMAQVTAIGTINYLTNNLYRADGVKLRKTVYQSGGKGSSSTTHTDYLDSFHYTYGTSGEPTLELPTLALEREAYVTTDKTIAPAWTLDFVPTAEGFYSFTENRYIYQYKDHLGNARISFAKTSAGVLEITDTNNYYPFGLNHIGGVNKGFLGSYFNYKYNGKEIQESGMYDYGARFYMPDAVRWLSPDPLSEEFSDWTPYNYTFNNPIKFIDPDGNAPEDSTEDGCCQHLKGFVLTVADNVMGTNLRNKYAVNSSDYRKGVNNGHGASIALGAALIVDGGASIGGGTTGMAASQTATASVVGAEVGVPGMALSGGAIAKGTIELAGAAVILKNTVSNMDSDKSSKKESSSSANKGRSGKQARLRELGKDPKVSSFNRGWIKNELRHIKNGDRKTIRNPRNSRNSKTRGTELAHPRGKRAKDGNSYKDAKLQDADLHKLEHKYGGYK
ncbi:DUF6443 domain-containing protein [Chryseobacterium sp. CT-SW4]|uniref:DUF6443 domain-containing protein n=1 Tax=Chryseobacterium sp. SW-1 TaxID=3157343 RepID=UPI003B023919